MEAVPRLPMVSFELKLSPEPVSFGPKLKQYIAEFYHEDADTYSNEIHALESLRSAAVRPAKDVTGCSTMKRYYAQLHALQGRFPLGKGPPVAVSFTWRDIYASMVCTTTDIRMEMAAILYNIGALHTQLGAADSRGSADGMKLACTHFQCAAWAFQHLRENYPQPLGADICPEMMQFMHSLSLAQAQECILEKSMADNRKATIVAKVAVQVVEYYNQSLAAMMAGLEEGAVADTVGSRLFKDWRKYILFKIAYCGCIALLFQGQQSEEQQKMGERVAYYQAAYNKLEEAIKLAKGCDNPEAINEAVSFTMDVVEGKRKAARNENEFIYHEEVPELSALTQIKGASLVKGIPFSITDPEVLGDDIFKRLVPMKAHEASSIYSEEKARLLRDIGGHVEAADLQLHSFLSALQLQGMTPAPEELPQALIDRCAALSARPGATQELIRAMDVLADTCSDVQANFQEIQQLLEDESLREQSYQSKMGARPTNSVITELTREFSKYLEAHGKAGDSNETLRRAMGLHVANLKVLSQPLEDIKSAMPRLTETEVALDEGALEQLQTILNKVDEMRSQRASLHNNLREAAVSDDITDRLIAWGEQPIDVLFNQEIQKHKDVIDLIEQNLKAQDNILKALTEAYARCAPYMKMQVEVVRKREAFTSGLVASFDAYEDLLGKTSKGTDFYKKLQTNVSKLLARVRSACNVQEEDRAQRLIVKGVAPSVTKSSEPSSGPVKSGPKLKDYLAAGLGGETRLPSIRPSPLGSEGTAEVSACAPDYSRIPSMSQYYPNSSSYYQGYDTNAAPKHIDGTSYSTPNNTATLNYNNQYNTASNYQYGRTGTNPNNPQYSNTNVSQEPQQILSDIKSQMYTAANYNNSLPVAPPSYSAATANDVKTYPNSYYPQNYSPNMYPAALNSASQILKDSSMTYATTVPQNVNVAVNYANDFTNTNASQYYTAMQNPQTYTAVNSTLPQQNQQSPYNSLQYSYPTASSPALAQPYSSMNLQNQTYASATAQPLTQVYTNAQIMQSQAYANTIQPAQGTQSYTAGKPQPQPQPAAYDYGNVSGLTQQMSDLSVQQGYQQSYQYPTYNYQNPANSITGVYNTSFVPNSKSITNLPDLNESQPVVVNPQLSQVYSYSGHPGYSYDQETGTFQYGSGYQTMQNHYNQNVNGHTQLYNTQIVPSPSQESLNRENWTPEMNYHYSSAGKSDTNNTLSSETTVQGQTYAYQYSNPAASTPSIASYYSAPYGNEAGGIAIAGPSGTPQGLMTYMYSGNTGTTTTNSQGKNLVSSSSSNLDDAVPSNVDLLAGLDFSPAVPTLTPELTKSQNKPKNLSSADIFKSGNVSATNSGVESSDKPEIVTKKEEVVPEITKTSSTEQSGLESLVFENNEKSNENKKAMLRSPSVDDEKDITGYFLQEVERLEKLMEGISTKTLNGPTPLETKWKELQDVLMRDSHNRSISVARCYPAKNRCPDSLPYDQSRVVIPNPKDDYINASFVKKLTSISPNFIITQAPLNSTRAEFWAMVWEQNVEVIVCLLTPSELDVPYFPIDRNHPETYGDILITLKTSTTLRHCTERVLSVRQQASLVPKERERPCRDLLHLQINEPVKSVADLVGVASEIVSAYNTQRSASHPILLHCLSGAGLSGEVCLTVCSVLSANNTNPSIIDLVNVAGRLCCQRKGALKDRQELQLALNASLYCAKEVLNSRGILTSRQAQAAANRRHTPPLAVASDPFSDLDPMWRLKKD